MKPSSKRQLYGPGPAPTPSWHLAASVFSIPTANSVHLVLDSPREYPGTITIAIKATSNTTDTIFLHKLSSSPVEEEGEEEQEEGEEEEEEEEQKEEQKEEEEEEEEEEEQKEEQKEEEEEEKQKEEEEQKQKKNDEEEEEKEGERHQKTEEEEEEDEQMKEEQEEEEKGEEEEKEEEKEEEEKVEEEEKEEEEEEEEEEKEEEVEEEEKEEKQEEEEEEKEEEQKAEEEEQEEEKEEDEEEQEEEKDEEEQQEEEEEEKEEEVREAVDNGEWQVVFDLARQEPLEILLDTHDQRTLMQKAMENRHVSYSSQRVLRGLWDSNFPMTHVDAALEVALHTSNTYMVVHICNFFPATEFPAREAHRLPEDTKFRIIYLLRQVSYYPVLLQRATESIYFFSNYTTNLTTEKAEGFVVLILDHILEEEHKGKLLWDTLLRHDVSTVALRHLRTIPHDHAANIVSSLLIWALIEPWRRERHRHFINMCSMMIATGLLNSASVAWIDVRLDQINERLIAERYFSQELEKAVIVTTTITLSSRRVTTAEKASRTVKNYSLTVCLLVFSLTADCVDSALGEVIWNQDVDL
ncbi:hypothetical protein ACOMHN_004098 [Nucella lapillus]